MDSHGNYVEEFDANQSQMDSSQMYGTISAY